MQKNTVKIKLALFLVAVMAVQLSGCISLSLF